MTIERRPWLAAARGLGRAGTVLLGAGLAGDILIHGPLALAVPAHLAHLTVVAGMAVVLAAVVIEGLAGPRSARRDRSES